MSTFFQVDHLLGGDYPVNASELSILKIILEWLESAQGASGKVYQVSILDSLNQVQGDLVLLLHA